METRLNDVIKISIRIRQVNVVVLLKYDEIKKTESDRITILSDIYSSLHDEIEQIFRSLVKSSHSMFASIITRR